jgi:hypothetical protein
MKIRIFFGKISLINLLASVLFSQCHFGAEKNEMALHDPNSVS